MGAALYGKLDAWKVRLPDDVKIDGTTLTLPHGLGTAQLTSPGLRQLTRLTQDRGASSRVPESAARRMVEGLERRGFVTVSLPLRQRPRAFLLAGIGMCRAPARVYPGSLWGVTRACVSATTWMLWLVVALTLWVTPLVMSLSVFETRTALILLSPLVFWLIFTSFLILHEGTHAVAVKATGGTVARVMARSHRIQLVSTPSSSRVSDIVIAGSGPVLTAIIGAGLAFALNQPAVPSLVVWSAGLLAALHLSSLAPFFADGKMLRRGVMGGTRWPSH
ncbi:MAG: hypothetical protein ACRCYX_01460 [Dermatophilaceae bacterium]